MGEGITGDQALALGAVAAGISMAASYPGSPSSGTMKALIDVAKEYSIYVEWSANERVALEMAIGASMAGRRSLVCTKSVGMNVMVDTLMCLNLTGVNGGLVILLGDDPGAYGSQNDQDTRLLATLLELPMLEPASPSKAFEMMKEAFELSERFNTAIILRVTRSFTQSREAFEPDIVNVSQVSGSYQEEPYRFVPYPGNAVAMHAKLHQRLADFETWANKSQHNVIVGMGPKGILVAGFAYRKLMDVLGVALPSGIRILKLGCINPLPKQVINEFARGCEEILVLEEIDPYVENQLKVALYDLGLSVRLKGKQSGHVNWEGELFRWHIQKALENFLPAFKPKKGFLAANEDAERPAKADHCQYYAYEEVLEMLLDVSRELNQKPIIIADPGCMVKVADQLDAKFAIGSAVAVASGLSKTGCGEKVVAFYGDSAFFHSTIPAICNAAGNQSELLMILLDNSGAASTGLQPSLSSGIDAFGYPIGKLSIPAIAGACGVQFIRNHREGAAKSEIRKSIKEGLGYPGLALVIISLSRDKQLEG
jgi:indolepyruvate ferredoxin oxidoreductase alpha subunit